MTRATVAVEASIAAWQEGSSCRWIGSRQTRRRSERVSVPGVRVRFIGLKKLNHWEVQAAALGAILGDIVTGIGVAHDARAGIIAQDASQTACGGFGAIGNDDHTGMLAEPHADPATVMETHP